MQDMLKQRFLLRKICSSRASHYSRLCSSREGISIGVINAVFLKRMPFGYIITKV